MKKRSQLVAVSCLLCWPLLARGQSTLPAVFVTNNVGDSVTSFTLNTDGSLNRVGVFAAGDGPQTISLTDDGRLLAVGHGTVSATTEQLRIYQVNSDATLSPLFTGLVPDSPLDVQWLTNDTLAVTETDFSDSFVRVYKFDETANLLTEIDSEVSGGFNTRLARSADKSRLFANNTLGNNSIYSYAIDAAGELTPVDNQTTAPLFAVDIASSQDGRFLYGAGGISGDGQQILGFSVDGGGALTPLVPASYSSPGDSPKVLAITQDDSLLVAGHGRDGSAWSFLRDPATGQLTSTNFSFDVGGQGELGDLQIMGDLMFVTDTSTAFDGVSGLYSIRVQPDGSFSQMGPLVSTLGARPEYIAPWPGLTTLACDFDGDANCNLVDLNLMLAEGPIAAGVAVTPGQNEQFDLDGNGVINLVDQGIWLADAATTNGLGSPYKLGDANLDGVVDVSDFNLWTSGKFTSTLDWGLGDFNGDGVADVSDFNLWNGNRFTTSNLVNSAVPEPSGLFGLGSLVGLCLIKRLCQRRRED